MPIGTLEVHDFESLAHLLRDALSAEKTVRTEAENQIDYLAEQFQFLQSVVAVVLLKSPDISKSQKLIALSILKRKANQLSIEESVSLVSALSGVFVIEENIQVVKLSGAVVAALLKKIDLCLNSNSQAVQCFEDFFKFVSDNLNNSECEWICLNVLLLLKELLTCLPSNSLSSESIACLAPDILKIALAKTIQERNCVAIEIVSDVFISEMINKKKHSFIFIKESWENIFPSFMDAMFIPCSIISAEGEFKGRFCMGFMKLFDGLIHYIFKSTTYNVWETFFRRFLACLEADSSFYCGFHGSCDDGSDVFLVHKVLAKRWSVFVSFMRVRAAHRLIKNVLEANQEILLRIILIYTVLPDSEINMWFNDVSAFLRQEEEQEDSVIHSVRDTAADACQTCVSVLGVNFLWVIFNSLNAICESDLWKNRESCLFLFDIVLQRCSNVVMGAKGVDITTFLQILLEKDMHGNPVLAARALSVIGRFLFLMRHQQLDAELLCHSLFRQTVLFLESPVILLRAAACKQLQKILPIASINDIESFCLQGQHALFTLILNDTTKDDFLYIALEVCTEWMSRCHSDKSHVVVTKGHEMLVTVWRNYIQDPNLGELVVPLFSELITEENGDQSFIEQIPWLSNVLQGQCSAAEYCAVPFVIEIIEKVFEKGSDNVTSKSAECFLDSLCKVLLTTDASSILVAASNCLAALLRRCPQASTIAVCLSPSVMDPGLQTSQDTLEEPVEPYPLSTVLITIASYMLKDKSEITLMNIGKLISAIARNAEGFQKEEMYYLITTIVTRLLTVRTDTVSQELVAPLAILLKRHMTAFLHVLLTANLLVETFSAWLSKMSVIMGKEDLLQSCDALLDLLFQWPFDDSQNDQMLSWGTDKKKHLIPLNLAVFVAVGKGILNLSTQLSTNDDSDGDYGDLEEDEWPIDVDDDDKDDADGEKEISTSTDNFPHEMRLLLQRVRCLLSQYGSASSTYFSRNELDELNYLLDQCTLESELK